MALERKPVEESQAPGYPSVQEYVTGRRAFLGLLGLTALGVGGAYALRSQPEAEIQGRIAAPQPQSAPPQPQPPVAVPQAPMPGVQAVDPVGSQQAPIRPVEPAHPEAQIDGDTSYAKPPEIKPLAPPPGVPPRPQPMPPKLPTPDGVKAPAQPAAPMLGEAAPVLRGPEEGR